MRLNEIQGGTWLWPSRRSIAVLVTRSVHDTHCPFFSFCAV